MLAEEENAMTEMDTNEKAMKAARKAIEKLVEDGTITEKALTENARSKIVEPYTRLLKALGFEFVWPAGYISPRIKQCPKCGSRNIAPAGAGRQRPPTRRGSPERKLC